MRIRLFTAVLALMTVIGVKAYAQDASLYQKYAVKGDADAMYNLAGCYWNGSGGADKDYTMAAYWYEKSAKKNNVAAMHITGYCYLYGIGVTQDWRKAWEYAEKAVKKGFGSANWIKALVFKEGYMSNMTGGYTRFLTEAANSGYDIAQSELGKLYLYGSTEYSVTRNYANAFKYLSSAADNGNAEGMYYLGVCYDNGMGTPKNHDKALEYYERAAQLGDTNAQAQVGYTYLIGDSVSPDYSTAYSYLKAAADKDNAYACGKIGDIYYYGLGVDENNNTAMDMYKKAAGLGDAHSMCQLAYMYGYGIGASEDNALMYKYYKQAAELNYAAGQCGLGDCYMNGYGVTKNVYTAFSWYKKAADQNSSAGLYQLATCYLNGTGTSKNTNQYIVYLRKAADNDYTQAMSALGYEYYSGENVSGGKDLALAIKWFKAAAKNDDVYSQAILGYSYYKGEELVSYKDYDQAFQYLYQAARNSDFEYLDDDVKANIYHYLAGCYRYGRGTSVDQSLASYYTEQAAKYGNSDSQRASGLLRKTYNESDNSPYANGPTASSSSGAQSSRRSSSMGSDYSEQTTLTSNAGADRASQYYVLRKPAQNDNYIKYATSEALDLYNEGVEEGRKGNYSKAFDCYFKSLNGGCDMAANNLAYLYAYGRGVKKDLNMARYYIDLALQGFKDKNLIYPQGDGFWYANVLDSKGEICVLDNDMDEAFKIFTVIADTKDASHEETTFIQMMMNALRIDDSSSSSQSSANPVIINAPSNAINTDSHKWEVVSVEVRDDCTYLYKRVSPKTSSTYVLSYTDEYIEDANTGEKYYLTGVSSELCQ